MNQWNFVAGAYLVTLIGVGGLVLRSWLSMRRAEARLDDAANR